MWPVNGEGKKRKDEHQTVTVFSGNRKQATDVGHVCNFKFGNNHLIKVNIKDEEG